MTSPGHSRLCLFRHAHTSRALPGQRDHERTLDERGRRDAPAVGAAMAETLRSVRLVTCSTAVRALQTLELIRKELSGDCRIETGSELYDSGWQAYLAAARSHGTATSMLMIGHNPAIEEFVSVIAPQGEVVALERLRAGFPTGGLAVVEFPQPLRAIAPGAGYLRTLMRPVDLGSRG